LVRSRIRQVVGKESRPVPAVGVEAACRGTGASLQKTNQATGIPQICAQTIFGKTALSRYLSTEFKVRTNHCVQVSRVYFGPSRPVLVLAFRKERLEVELKRCTGGLWTVALLPDDMPTSAAERSAFRLRLYIIPFAGGKSMKTILCRAVLSAFLLIAALTPAPAQDWPSRNVTVVVPVPAGVASDIVARLVFEQVGKQVGHTFVIENRPGAGGTIGGSAVAKAAPDGHTILVWGSIAAANALYTKLPYDTLRDFTPVVALGQTPLVVVTGPGHFKSLSELVSTAKATPGKLNYATVGVGSAAHFGAEQLAVSAGFSAQHAPFNGREQAYEGTHSP